MKCPKCGTEIDDGYLYCEKCGKEINIVPDFEPEIEYSMRQTFSGIVEDVIEEFPQEQTIEETGKDKNKKYNKTLITFCIAGALLVALLLSVWATNQYRYYSVDYQISKANACVASGNIEKAIDYYERAAELDGENIPLWFAMADLYSKAGLEVKYVECLNTILSFKYTTQEEVEAAYKKLITYYKNKEDYVSINTLLTDTENEEIKTLFQNYMAAPPEFSYKEGTYAEVVPLKLTASTQGTIYYTLDGTTPNEKSEVYTTPIFLETGSYVISAMFVNEYGIKSEIVDRSYVIDVLKPTAPEVETYSGEYMSPTMIYVIIPPGCNVYYTTDQSMPTDQSTLYTGRIPMPIGKSTFKFVTYNEDGVSGDCTTRQFELELDTDFTPDMAVSNLVEVMLEIGKIQDYDGTVNNELNGRYLYYFQFALAIPEAGDFYVISEIYEDSTDVQNKTGTTYAVNVYTQEYYRLLKDASDEYVLEAF